jgi:hypothetical protein
MKQALPVLAILGVLAWIAEVALLVVLTQSRPIATPTPADGSLPWIVPVFGLLQWTVPALGLVVGILGAVSASGRHAARWATLFVTLAVLVVALLVLSFAVAVVLVLFVLPFGKPGPVVDAIAAGATDLSFLFPIVVFATALLYVVRGGAQSDQATGQS